MNQKQVLKLIDEQKYEEALKILLKEDKYYLLKIQCLYELKKYEDLNNYFNEIKDHIEEDYYEILGFHLLALMERHEYDEAINLLNEELAMPYVESDYLEVMNDLYDEIVAQKQMYLIEHDMYNDSLTEEDIKDVLKNETDFDAILNVIMRLDDFNIRNIMTSIKAFLVDETRSSVLKSFILELLIKQQINEVVLVKKNNYEYEFMPLANELVKQNHHYIQTSQLLSAHLDKKPSLLNMCLDVLDLVAYSIYPQTIDEKEVNLYAGTIEYYVHSLNYEPLPDDFSEYYHISEAKVSDNVNNLVKLLDESKVNEEV